MGQGCPPWGRPLQKGSAALCKPRVLLSSQPHLLLSILHQSQILLQVPGSEAQVSASPDHVSLARCHQLLEGCPHACSSSQKELMVLMCVCFRGLAGARPPPGLASRDKRFSRAFNPSKKQHASGAALGAGVAVASSVLLQTPGMMQGPWRWLWCHTPNSKPWGGGVMLVTGVGCECRHRAMLLSMCLFINFPCSVLLTAGSARPPPPRWWGCFVH